MYYTHILSYKDNILQPQGYLIKCVNCAKKLVYCQAKSEEKVTRFVYFCSCHNHIVLHTHLKIVKFKAVKDAVNDL